MSADEQIPTSVEVSNVITDPAVERERSEKILRAKELYSHGSRNYLVKSYSEAADELSEVCALYEELYGGLADELGMPYLLYAKSLIALALDENKVIDVPDQEDDDDDEEDVDEEDEPMNGEAASSSTNGAAKLNAIKEHADEEQVKKSDEADSTEAMPATSEESNGSAVNATAKSSEEGAVSSTDDADGSNGAKVAEDGEKPSTSNGDAEDDTADAEEEAASNLQLAWEILELAAKIFSRQGLSGLPNLAEVQTELANIEFENNILDAAREDYEKALKIYKELPSNYRRAMAEIHYKIGLTYLMHTMNKEGAASLKEACDLIEEEIVEIKAKPDLNEKDKNNIQDMEETKQEILAKIAEIEEAQQKKMDEVRAALDSYIKPIHQNAEGAGPSSSSAGVASSNGDASSSTITSSSKPTDISHLIKRKKPEEPSSEADAATASPAKRPAV